MTAAQLFQYADQLSASGQYASAETAYRALAKHPEPELRREARFRLAMMMAHRQRRYGEAALELRLILDEKPDAAGVRLELARIEAMDGQVGAATRDLRAAQAGRLPVDVERMVRFYEQVLSAQRPYGGSLEINLAPDSNVNRATSSGTLGTVLGDFTLDDRAKAHSGLGLGLRGQAYARQGLSSGLFMVGRVSASADLYRQTAYQDVVLAPAAGPELVKGRHRITLSGGPLWRWHGGQLYTSGALASAAWSLPLSPRTQGRLELAATGTTNHFNALENGHAFTLSASLDHAFSASTGGTLRSFANRVEARDPAFANRSAGASVSLWADVGHTTVVASAGGAYLQADARFALFPDARRDISANASLAASFRHLRWHGFVPLLRARYERNWSSVGLWDYSRFSGEVGVGSVL
ncbi:surface lipoprotein assembly modifier [Novosphingobium umbonatum]|nr:surface lipoprotein assembly modifier [Novosphingobium umbonatum]